MEIKDVQRLKSELDANIRNIIVHFEEKTGTYVSEVKLQRLPLYTGDVNYGGLIIEVIVKV